MPPSQPNVVTLERRQNELVSVGVLAKDAVGIGAKCRRTVSLHNGRRTLRAVGASSVLFEASIGCQNEKNISDEQRESQSG